MNWTDEEIDKLFQESASQMNAPAFQESFWDEMEAMLPPQKKRKGLGWIFGGTLTSFALIAAMIFPVNQFSVKTAKNGIAKQNRTLPAVPGTKTTFTTNSETALPAAQVPVATFASLSETPAMQTAANNGALRTQRIAVPAPEQDKIAVLAENPVAAEVISTPAEVQTVTETEETAAKLRLLSFGSSLPELAAMTYPKFASRQRTQNLYVQAGAGIAQSYIKGGDQNWMPTVALGAGYQYRPQGFGFSAGMNISGVFANNMEITRRSKIYNFSSTNYEQNLAYKQLYSVELPVSVDFRKNRHTLSLGVAPTYLAGSVMRFTQFENGDLSENGMYIGQKAGLNTFGLKTGIGYQLEIAKSWNLGIQLNAQMIQQVDAKQFVGEATKMPLSGQITIRKNILK